jgi:HK97 family phage prohead protease
MNLQHKLSRPFAYKSVGNAVKDIDTSGRQVVFYANAFDKKDDQLDILRKGCFSKSINEWGPTSAGNRKIKHCLFHDETQLPGAIKELSQDAYGLLTVVKMSDTTLGNDTLQYYSDGVYNEHSIRIGYVKDKIKWVEDTSPEGGYFDVTEVKLWHTATVSFGSNEYTPVVGIKSLQTEEEINEALLKLNERMSSLTKAITSGKYSDEAFKKIAYDLKEVQDAYNSLITAKPVAKSTLIDNEPNETKTATQPDYSFLKSFKLL